MSQTAQQWLPVAISILVIIAIALLQAQSKTIAAVTATMPLTIPLAMWIVYAANRNDQAALTDFAGSLLVGVIATLIFAVALWLAARAGLGLVPMLATAYLAWAAALGVYLALR
ncbi:MAG: hypothetical protein GX613_17785 [Chloroflexi bacterium]|nr:hypothetical protein [Chloroflexota bacterium]